MYYKQKKDTSIRKYENYGYITSTGIYNDQLFNDSGSIFLMEIERFPQSLEEIVKRIVNKFIDVTEEMIIKDVEEFLENLVEDGFLVKGETKEECEANDVGFSYSLLKDIKNTEDYSPINIRSSKSTQEVLRKHLLKHPHLSSFQIEITSTCNERCIHCYIPHEFKTEYIEPKIFYRVLDELEEMDVLNVTLSGGEPMMHPQFIDFLKAAKKKDFNVGILSNLVLLNDEMIDMLKQGNVSYVQVSLYSMNPEHHDKITTLPGSFNKTINSILKLVENNVPVQISCPVMKTNKDDYIEVARWAHEHKIRSTTDYSIMAKYNHDDSNLVNRLTPNECVSVLSRMIEEDQDYQKMILSDSFESNVISLENREEEPFCGVGISTCCMGSNGDIFPCSGWQEYVCGNLYEKTLKEIWNNSKELNYLRSIRKGDIKECLNCKNKAFCSPCLSRFANESKTGNPLEVAKHFCDVAEINRKVVMDWREKHGK